MRLLQAKGCCLFHWQTFLRLSQSTRYSSASSSLFMEALQAASLCSVLCSLSGSGLASPLLLLNISPSESYLTGQLSAIFAWLVLCLCSISSLSFWFCSQMSLIFLYISSCYFRRWAISFSSLWSSITTFSPVSYRSTGTILQMSKHSSNSRLSIARPNSTRTRMVLTSYSATSQGPTSRYTVTPKASTARANCRYYFLRLQGSSISQSSQKNTRKPSTWQIWSSAVAVAYWGELRQPTIRKAQAIFLSMSSSLMLEYFLICLEWAGRSSRLQVGNRSQSAENRKKYLQWQYFQSPAGKFIRQKHQDMQSNVSRTKTTPRQNPTIDRALEKSGFSRAAATTNAMSCRVKQKAQEKMLPMFLLMYFWKVRSAQLSASFMTPIAMPATAKNSHVATILSTLLMTVSSVVQMGMARPPETSFHPSAQSPQPRMPRYSQTCRFAQQPLSSLKQAASWIRSRILTRVRPRLRSRMGKMNRNTRQVVMIWQYWVGDVRHKELERVRPGAQVRQEQKLLVKQVWQGGVHILLLFLQQINGAIITFVGNRPRLLSLAGCIDWGHILGRIQAGSTRPY